MSAMITKQQAQKNISLLNILTFISGFRAFEGVIAVYFFSITGSFSTALLVLSTLSISVALFEVPTGILSDRIGRKRTIILHHAMQAIAIGCYAIAQNLTALMLGAVILGIAMALRSGTTAAFVYENLEIFGEKNFSKYEGYRQALGRYALVFAGIFGAAAIYFFDMRTAVVITFVVLSIGFIASFFLHDIQVSSKGAGNVYADLKKAMRLFASNPSLRDIGIGKMIMVGGGNFEYRMRSLFFAGLFAEWVVNLLGMVNNFISGWAMKHTHWIVEKFGIHKSLVGIGVADRVSTIFFVLLNTIPGAWIMTIFTSFVFGIRAIASQNLLQQKYSKEQRATMGSLVGLGGSIIYAVLSIAAGLIADQIGIIYTIVLIQPVLLFAAFFYHRGITHGNHK